MYRNHLPFPTSETSSSLPYPLLRRFVSASALSPAPVDECVYQLFLFAIASISLPFATSIVDLCLRLLAFAESQLV